jgi:sulfonate transport system permease protein
VTSAVSTPVLQPATPDPFSNEGVRPTGHTWQAPLIVTIASLLLWWVVGATDVAGHGSIPTPWVILHSLWDDRALYPSEIQATMSEAAKGFLYGGGAGLVLGCVFSASSKLKAVFHGPVIVVLCVPILIWGPLLSLAISSGAAKVGIAAVAAFLPVLIGTMAGLRSADRDSMHMVRGFGGGQMAQFTKVRVRSALPLMLAGVQVSVPGAILGATIGEYVGGNQGLGIFMLQSLRQYLPPRTWAAGLVVTALCAAGYLLVGIIGRRWLPPPGSLGTSDDALKLEARRSPVTWLVRLVLPIVSTVVLWQLFLRAFHLSSFFARRPHQVLDFFLHGSTVTPNGRSLVFHGLFQTLPGAALGIVVGLAFGLAVATLCVFSRTVESVTLPVALTLQSVPLQAFSPILVLFLGRGLTVVVVISVVVSFFPTVVLASKGLRQVSEQSLHLFHGANASAWQTLVKLRLPAALPGLVAAARIAVPASVLGVLVAEFIATGNGIGYVLDVSQASSEFDVMWGAAVALTVVTVLAYCATNGVERLVNRRLR